MKNGRKPEYLEKTLDGELQKTPHILKPEYSSLKRDSNPRSGIGGRFARKIDVLTIKPCVVPSCTTE